MTTSARPLSILRNQAAAQQDHSVPDTQAGIPNHVSARLSPLDMQIVRTIPPGGNWKDVPRSIPSKRLDTIRESYKAGLGSRSTYYGRLRPDLPSYTINTYLTRPGNGCHIHYAQDRVLSFREAARLQSFPDSFEFLGSRRSIAMQIGNAVPPLLAYQIATALGEPGLYMDLFAGAGGFGLGFKWAGWQPVLASDIESSFLDTYRRNVHSSIIHGDIRDPQVRRSIKDEANKIRRTTSKPFWILGGPPCQGFSTAGKPRSMQDDRNLLFYDYKTLIDVLQPDGFVFENVRGLLNMDDGRVFRLVKEELSAVMPNLSGWVLASEEFGVPQRRTRVLLVGARAGAVSAPIRQTTMGGHSDLFGELPRAVTTEEALSDLPPLEQGEDGSTNSYLSAPKTLYQRLMRGYLSAQQYLAGLRPD